MILRKLICGSLLVLSSTAFAQWKPVKPIEVIIGFAPGSVNETSFRALAKEVEQNTGAKFIVVNKGGAGGVIGTQELAGRPADGYSVSNVSVPGISAMDKISVPENRNYTTDSFVYPTHIASSPFVVVANTKDTVSNAKQFVDVFKTEKITIAASGGARLPYESLYARLGITGDSIVRVDHKGPVDALVDVAGGNVRFAIVPSVVAFPLHKDGKVKIVATTSSQLSQLPEVKTLDSVVPGINVGGVWALMLPANTPKEIVDWYTTEFVKAMKSESAKKFYNDNLLNERPDLQNPESMKSWVKSRETQWQPLVTNILSKINQK